MDHRWFYMERPLGKTPMLFFRSLRGLAKASFNRKDPSNPSRGSFKGSFRRTSLTAIVYMIRFLKDNSLIFSNIWMLIKENVKYLLVLSLFHTSYCCYSNILIIKSGRKFENVALDSRVKSLQTFEFGLISRTYPY